MVAHQTQYFADPFEASESRKKWVDNKTAPRIKEVPKVRSQLNGRAR
jgi:hypothetical protein